MNALDAARSITAECLCFRSRRLARLITRVYDEALRPLGLEGPQLTLLNAVAIGETKNAPMRVLADALGMEISTLSRNLKPLEGRGAVLIDRLPGDRRVRVAKLTAKGRALLEQAWPLWRKASNELQGWLSNEAAGDLRKALDHAAARTASRGRSREASVTLPAVTRTLD